MVIRRHVWVLAASLALAVLPPREGSAQPAPASANAPAAALEGLAREIIDSLRARQSMVQRWTGLGRDRLKLAVEPFAPEEVPVDEGMAEEIHAAFRASLVRAAGTEFTVVARSDLAALFREAREFSDNNPFPALLKSARADVLIRGRLQPAGGGVAASFSAVSIGDTATLAETGYRPLGLAPGGAGAPRLLLEPAIAAAARLLAGRASQMEEMRLGGMRFQTTGVQPAFGRYLEARIAEALKHSVSNHLSGRQLIVRAAEGDVRREAMRGIEMNARPQAVEMGDAGPGVYLLTGIYWDHGEAVEIALQLRNSAGESAQWRGQVRRDSIPASLDLRPPPGFDDPHKSTPVGPLGFTLASARGRDPAYRIGEKLNLLVRLDQPAWLYCFYSQADGQTFKIFPNFHHRTARLSAGPHSVPGDMLPFEFTFRPPEGVELLKCFALGRDVQGDLPPELRSLDERLSPVPRTLAQRLPQIFRTLRDAPMSEASLVITVER
jgi:hypothetical protein